jgi:acyl-CoA reductase-like NAD-dependent aldehyde dehydrogenase
VGNAIVEHDGIALISFTGSSEVGWGIVAKAPRKRVKLELGNSTPVIVEPDADWEQAADKISVAGFSHAGQSCISTQRVYVHAAVADDFCAQLAKRVGALHVGDPMDDGTDVSSLISEPERDRVKQWVDEAVAAGAEVLVGGEVTDGLLQPTVLRGVTPDMKVCAQEVFGPVVGVQVYTELDDALDLANSTDYGLQAGIFTARIDVALRAARAMSFGGITVNEVPTWRADQMPYGGVNESGNTKEGPAYTVAEMTERRLVVIQP